jgi:hypothetical protein
MGGTESNDAFYAFKLLIKKLRTILELFPGGKSIKFTAISGVFLASVAGVTESCYFTF